MPPPATSSTATGFNLSLFGDVAFTVDGEPVDFTERVTWRGIMINGLPNMAYAFGYFRHSWTLRVDLVSDLVGRLLANMGDKGATMVVPPCDPQDADMPLRPWCDPENFNAGYVMRSQHILFKQGDREPWTHMLEHEQELEILPRRTSTTGRSSTAESGPPARPTCLGRRLPRGGPADRRRQPVSGGLGRFTLSLWLLRRRGQRPFRLSAATGN